QSGLADFPRAGAHADGDEDWVLVLEAGGPSAGSFVEFTVNADTFHAGDQLDVGLDAFNAPQQPVRSLFAGLVGPDGQTLVYFTGPNAVGGVASVGSLESLQPLASVAPGQRVALAGSNLLLPLQIPRDVPPGAYTWFGLLVPPGILPNNVFDTNGGNVVAFRSVNLLP